ncbi:germin-like protein subfamily 1 member 19 [Tripterygium wilfordii]|uniref:germin-like protein subfamily 1 member 19 n=1 Tax=Tripterygium wilfordii TaxID=458696 RepID=UPI0018F8624B|nr:germin-like protein subfamily 1 member 19 [Tripterygium wilfordii]
MDLVSPSVYFPSKTVDVDVQFTNVIALHCIALHKPLSLPPGIVKIFILILYKSQFVNELPGRNTLGMTLVRIDYALYGGLNLPYTHPRNIEILVVMEGTLYVGFVTSNVQGNRLFAKVLNSRDVFVFLVGMVNFQLNIGKTNIVDFGGLTSQNFGVIPITNVVFGFDLPINPDVLTKAFQLDKNIVEYLQKLF